MDQVQKEYISSIIPKTLKSGKELLEEGVKIGQKINPKYPKYFEEKGYKNKLKASINDLPSGRYNVNIGMATVEETLSSCLELARWGEEIGIPFAAGLLLPSVQAGVPKEKRDENLDTTAFQLNTLDDYAKFNHEELYMPLSNHSIGSPNVIELVINGLEAGLPTWGSTTQLSWDYPGCDNHKEDVENLVKALGIIQANMEYCPDLGCYAEDGLAGSLVDTVGIVACYLLERYIYTDLCGIPLNPCFGALVSDIRTKAALMVALDHYAKERGCYLSFVHGSTTTQWDHDIAGNYGASAQEMLLMFLTIDHYNLGGTGVLAVPATEAITVPTLQEIKDIVAATGRTKEFVDQWRDLIDWTEIDRRAEILIREGFKMYRNILEDLEEIGVDITDPVPLLMMIKDIDSSLMETFFHPSVRENGVFEPWFPNDMGQWTLECANMAIAELKENGFDENSLKGKDVVVASTDAHAYGAKFVVSVLTALGANVIDMGVDNSPQHIVDMAVEVGTKLVCSSTHSGNALAMGNYFEKYIQEQGLDIKVSMGGILTSILPGHSEPSQVGDMINENNHIIATNDMKETLELFKTI